MKACQWIVLLGEGIALVVGIVSALIDESAVKMLGVIAWVGLWTWILYTAGTFSMVLP